MAPVVVALITFAVAFVAGAVLSKAYFAVQHGSSDARARRQLDAQRQRYRKRLGALQNAIRQREDAHAELLVKLADVERSRPDTVKIQSGSEDLRHGVNRLRTELQMRNREIVALRERIGPLNKTLDAERRSSEEARNELSLLRIERDELLARLQRLEAGRNSAPPVERRRGDADTAAGLRAELGEMREMLARRDRQVHELELKLTESTGRILDLAARLDSWKERVKPLTSMLRQQRNLIRTLHDVDTEGGTDRQAGEDDTSGSPDNLKRIRGIGPALERRLHRHGIRRFEQIAELSDADLFALAKHIAIAPNLVQRDRWVEQARELVDERAAIV